MGNQHQIQGKPKPGQGYRIIQIEENSIASQTDLQIFLDYIIDAKVIGQQSNEDKLNFYQILNDNVPIQLTIFNIFSQTIREISLRNQKDIQNPNLGLSLRLESYENPLVLRITNVLPNSPAQQSGLQKSVDFVLGLVTHTYTSLNEFSDLVSGISYRKGQKLDLCVFTPSKYENPRMIYLEPQIKWGGPGSLGCEFASGVLHTFPAPQNKQEKIQEVQLDKLLVKNEEVIQQEIKEKENIKDEMKVEQQKQKVEEQEQNNIQEEQEEQKIVQQNKSQQELLENQQTEKQQEEVIIVPQEEYQYKKEENDNKNQNQQIDQNVEQNEETIQFKGVPRYESGAVQQQDMCQTLTEEQSNVNQNSQMMSQSNELSQMKLDQMENPKKGLSSSNQEQAREPTRNEIKETDSSPTSQQVFQSPKQQEFYEIDRTLLFDLTVQLEFKPVYFF